MTVCLINTYKLVNGLKFDSNKTNNVIDSIKGLREFMIRHNWKRLPVWVYTPIGRDLMIKTIQVDEDMLELRAVLKEAKEGKLFKEKGHGI